MRKEQIKHEIPLVTKQLRKSEYELNASAYFFVSSHLQTLYRWPLLDKFVKVQSWVAGWISPKHCSLLSKGFRLVLEQR